MKPTEEQFEEMKTLKRWLPYRIVYGARNPRSGEWRVGAVHTKREPNKLVRAGWEVVTI